MARINAHNILNDLPIEGSRCPLGLTLPGSENLGLWGTVITFDESAALASKMRLWLRTTPLLPKLRSLQERLDPIGVLEGDPNDEDFLAAMTLRDCTIYVRMVEGQDPRKWEARIGDLDLKSPAKSEYWRRIETDLIEEGWYEGKEKERTPGYNNCLLREYEAWRAAGVRGY